MRGRATTRLPPVRFALVAKDVVLVDDEERLRQTRQLVDRRSERGRADIGASVDVRKVAVPEPGHRVGAKVEPFCELPVALRVLTGVGHRVVQRLVDEGDVAATLRENRDDGCHVPADGITGDGETRSVQTFRRAVVRDPACRRVHLFDSHGVMGFRRAVVLDEDDCRIGAGRKLAHETVVRAGVTQHPAATVDVEHDRQLAAGTRRLHDADPHVSDLRRDSDPLVDDIGLCDRRRLDVVEELSRALDTEVGEERRRRSRVGEGLRLRLQNVVGHDRVLSDVR